MNASNKSDNTPIVVSSVADFTEWVDRFGSGNILFRGMANTEWLIESSLHRRLQHNNVKVRYHDHGIYHNIFMEMVKILINRSRRNGHDIEKGRELKDLELLANLQHYGAATCLIDFTKNSLVALYFACASVNSEDDKANGKVIAFNSDDTNFCEEISIENFDKEIEHWFKEYKENKKFWVLSPKKFGNRIISQQSVFIFGNPILPNENFHICEIINKEVILTQLKKYGISAETLFDDFVGFSAQNSYNKKYEDWNTDSYFKSGMICYMTGDYESAIKYYDKEINSNLKSWAAYHHRGIAKDDLGKSEDAIADYNTAIILNPEASVAYNGRGIAKYNLGRPQDAIDDYNKAIKLNPKSPMVYNNRGNCKNELGQFQEAITDYDKSIELDSEYSIAYYNRGNAKCALGNLKDAIIDYNNAIKLNPKFSMAYNNRGNCKNELGQFQEAIADYNNVIKFTPKDWEAYYNRGFAKRKLGNKEGADADFAKSKEIELEIKNMQSNNSDK